MNNLPYAEDVNYWKSGTTHADDWIEKAEKEIRGVGGKILGHAYGIDNTTGRAAFTLGFVIDGEVFKLTWPVLPSRTKNEKAAKIQAATFIYHDVKAKCMVTKVLGARVAFIAYSLLPDGRTVHQATSEEIGNALTFLTALPEPNGR